MSFQNVELPIKKLFSAHDIPMPCYMSKGASGMDIYAAVEKDVLIKEGKTALIPTGFTVAVPEGFEIQIRPRSGLAVREGIGILNSPGTIDSDYRGEIKIIIINLGEKPFVVKRGDRIAQMVLCPVVRAIVKQTAELPPTDRNDGGFGHTGI
ncbi:MAG: dUTP diphosphatase [Bacillota bacterium]|nr:dUTP diphosphatase [Bacillota bacterium]